MTARPYTYDEVTALLRAIAHAPDPQRVTLGLRRQPRKAWAVAVRALLKELGIKGVSVTTPSYSMASSITIRLPHYDYTDHQCQRSPAARDAFCRQCERRRVATARMNAILNRAFPDLRDRSDYASDDFDFCFTVD